MFSFLEPVQQLVGLGSTLQEVEGEMNRLDDVLNYPADLECEGGAAPATKDLPAKLAGQLEFRDVTFGYNRLEAPLVDKLNLCLQPGKRVAVVGLTASGKSTLIKLASGLYQPWQGEVLLDGKKRSQLPRSLVASSVALVDQDFFFFEGSVREVLTMWDTTVPEENLVQAAKDACIHDEIAARPGGYDSKVDEGGANFSGGQRQRLEIARALVGSPALLILDEATSALDPITEKQIDENLRWRGCTCLIVAHRLSTIRDCDEIIVLERGKIAQRGTHESLIQDVKGIYHRLVTA
jgi:ABC-type bacteriocin/lantibiotic exporter with double-glycine peptidase domain